LTSLLSSSHTFLLLFAELFFKRPNQT
jgi:hypothetical protein